MTDDVQNIARWATLITLFLVSIIAILLYWGLTKTTKYYANCSQIKTELGRSYIKKGDPLYREDLDHKVNGRYNGIACE